MKPLFRKQSFLEARLLVFLGLSISLLWLDYRTTLLKNVHILLSESILPLEYIVHWPITAFTSLQNTLITQQALRQENVELKKELFQLHIELERFQALQSENNYLHALLGSSPAETPKGMMAEIIRVDPDPFSHKLTLNKGQKQGITVGQPLLDAYGIMGQVIAITLQTSTVLLITDLNHAISAKVNRNGVRLILEGSGNLDELVAYHAPSTTDILIGDLLVTSGLGQLFPAGYPLGTVTQIVQDKTDPFAKIVVKPVAKLSSSHPVLLLKPG